MSGVDIAGLVERLRAECVGHPSTSIAWPHRILHEAADALLAQAAELAEARREARNADGDLYRDLWKASSKNVGRVCGTANRLRDQRDEALAALKASEERGERLSQELASARLRPEPWQPIGTFKGDEAYVLVWDGGHVSEARYHPSEDGWWLANTHPTDAHDGQIYPTHWMPIPAPPSALENGPAGLADAHSNPPLSDLSSLRKGAEVWRTALKDCAQWLDVILAEKVIVEPENEQHIAASIARARAALVSGSREDGDG